MGIKQRQHWRWQLPINFYTSHWHSSLEFIDIVISAIIHLNQTINPPNKIKLMQVVVIKPMWKERKKEIFSSFSALIRP